LRKERGDRNKTRKGWKGKWWPEWLEENQEKIISKKEVIKTSGGTERKEDFTTKERNPRGGEHRKKKGIWGVMTSTMWEGGISKESPEEGLSLRGG